MDLRREEKKRKKKQKTAPPPKSSVEANYHFNEQDYNFHTKWQVWSGRKQSLAISLEMSINKKDVV